MVASATFLQAAVPPPADPLIGFYDRGYDPNNPPKEIQDIFKEARTDAKALEKLRDEPIAWSYKMLTSLSRDEYMPDENAHERQRIATEILQTHPGMGEFMGVVLTRCNEAFTEMYTKERPRNSPEWWRVADINNYLQFLYMARKRPGDEAFRLVGPCVSATPYWPEDPNRSPDVQVTAPAHLAYGHLRELIKERLPGEPVPKTVEEAREWWKANAKRFGAVPNGVPTVAAAAPQATPAPTASPTTPASEPVMGIAVLSSWWVLGLIALAAVGLCIGLIASRSRKSAN